MLTSVVVADADVADVAGTADALDFNSASSDADIGVLLITLKSFSNTLYAVGCDVAGAGVATGDVADADVAAGDVADAEAASVSVADAGVATGDVADADVAAGDVAVGDGTCTVSGTTSCADECMYTTDGNGVKMFVSNRNGTAPCSCNR